MTVDYSKGSRQSATLAADIRALVQEYAAEVQRIYEDDATGTWRGAPSFPVTDVTEGGDLILNVGPDGEERIVNIFRYVDEGTRVRYARMTNPFTSKSAPGRLQSGSGQGGFEELDFIPRPGIEARKFGEQIVKQLKAQFVEDVRKLIEG
jgi:hypothetical protein